MILNLLQFLAVLYLIWKVHAMNEAFEKAKTALISEVTESNGKLASIKAYLNGLPELVASAVASALANVDADETAAAAEIDAARESFSASVDETLAAIDQNPAPGDTPEPTPEPAPEPAPAEPATGEEPTT